MEVLVGYRRDPEIGPVVLLGVGGIAAELHKRVAVRVAPITMATAREMIDEIAELALLRGFRNLPQGDCEALAAAVQAISFLALSRRTHRSRSRGESADREETRRRRRGGRRTGGFQVVVTVETVRWRHPRPRRRAAGEGPWRINEGDPMSAVVREIAAAGAGATARLAEHVASRTLRAARAAGHPRFQARAARPSHVCDRRLRVAGIASAAGVLHRVGRDPNGDRRGQRRKALRTERGARERRQHARPRLRRRPHERLRASVGRHLPGGARGSRTVRRVAASDHPRDRDRLRHHVPHRRRRASCHCAPWLAQHADDRCIRRRCRRCEAARSRRDARSSCARARGKLLCGRAGIRRGRRGNRSASTRARRHATGCSAPNSRSAASPGRAASSKAVRASPARMPAAR